MYGPRAAVGLTALSSLAFPKWVTFELLDTPVDLRVSAGIAALAFYCLHPKAVFKTKLVLVDWAMLLLIAVNIVSDCMHDGANWMIAAQAYGEWFVPYVLGRIAVSHWEDIEFLLKPTACICVLISIAGIFECLTRQNLYELLVAVRPSEIEKYVDRMGWRRSFGPTENPIYLGTLLFILFPWTIHLFYKSIVDGKFFLWPFALIVHVAGVFSTISRAPILAIGLLPILPLVLLSPKAWRIPIAIAFAISFSAIAVNSSVALNFLHKLSGDVQEEARPQIQLDGQTVDYSATKHRFYLFTIYSTALRDAGLLGYGSDRTSVFPPLVPMGGKHDIEAVRKLWAIDNQFILTTLRFGYLGLLSWCGVLIASLATFCALSKARRLEQSVFYSLMAGALFAMPFIQFTVWMPHDYGFLLLWTCGIAAGAWSGKYQHTSMNSHFRYRKVPE